MRKSGLLQLGIIVGMAPGVRAAEAASVQLPQVAVVSPRVALQDPAGSFAMPVTALRFEPSVDIESRNLAEGQADVTIRGGIFENTGFRIGGVSLYDPQTGHYFAEIPVAPAMLSAPQILTGVDNALEGFTASAGTVTYRWQRVRPRGEWTVTGGQYDSYRASIYEGVVSGRSVAGRTLAADAEVSQAASDGSRPYGDYRFGRVNGRVQLSGGGGQTDLFYGYQGKFFGWPNLYTPFGSDETENLETVLMALNHRQQWSGGDWLEVGAFWRRNKDDYAFNRFAPVGAIHPFQHTTWAEGAAVSGRETFATFAVGYSAEVLADNLESTSLIFGRFHTRDYLKIGLAPEKSWLLAEGRRLTIRAGATWDDTNRDGSAVSPLVEVALAGTGSDGAATKLHLSYAQSTQVPTYTALNSSATAGLFRGNPNLGRSISRNVELGCDRASGAWQGHVSFLYRRDDQLVDWTFRQGVVARTANPVDIDTVGVEAVWQWSLPRGEVVLGYTVLRKHANYGGARVDGSFYALNFPKQRLTAAVTARLGGGFELRMDNEARVQEPNPLRTAGGNQAVISSLGVFFRPRRTPNLEVSLQVDNLWDSNFQEIPAVPASRRMTSAGMTYRW
jgi:vitamin B12 transporter